jgi:4-alpha-glucanotransferase
MHLTRASGVLLHPTSLPGRFAIGDVGPSAFKFADWLHRSEQSYWQTLPLGPTGYGDSPYQCLSAFAGNPLLISPEKLLDVGLISERDVADAASTAGDAARIDFHQAHKTKTQLLKTAYANFKAQPPKDLQQDFVAFSARHAHWLNDYALYSALKEEYAGASWRDWNASLAQRNESVLAEAHTRLQARIDEQRFVQFLFFKQWGELKDYCNERGIKLIGDMPIFVADDSAEVWCDRKLFKTDDQGKPKVVAGVPPDYFSATGQLWGNPIFDWDYMRGQNFAWWVKRFAGLLEMADIVRIDHFRGFAACWEIPFGDPTAERGEWIPAPGHEIFAAIEKVYPELPVIAEDLGVITPDVEELRDRFNFPGMRILQMAFRDDTNSDLPHNHVQNCVVYTGTHDNDTAVGWFNSTFGEGSTRTAEQIETEKAYCLDYLHSDGKEIHWDFIRHALASVATTAIIPMQDILGLGSKTRMNTPATMSGNWQWRFTWEELTDSTRERLEHLTRLYGRGK